MCKEGTEVTVFLPSISFVLEKPVKPVIILCTVLCVSEEFPVS